MTIHAQNPKKLLIFWISFQKSCYFFGISLSLPTKTHDYDTPQIRTNSNRCPTQTQSDNNNGA